MIAFGTPLVEKLRDLERRLSAERGGFQLFALMLRVNAEGVMDLVVSAPWLDAASRESVELMAVQVRSVLAQEELSKLSAVVVLGPQNPVVRAVNDVLSIEHGNSIFIDCLFNELLVKGAFIVTSRAATGPHPTGESNPESPTHGQ